MTATKSLTDQVRDGDRKVVVSLYLRGREQEYSSCSWDEAVELFARRMVNGFHWALPDWQWLDDDGTWGGLIPDDVDALDLALRRAAKGW